ncbi:hypothetical protein BP6252_05072 [Coleophoma cylindrospora]|uniref:Xylanolytic transcriptional activator regulatory domain-containing protein n=1 Tax=Coleophoma cylindrospora TaxID=1849047 RepID=A0A3D8RSJ8_9HELO|nr:hypothetical protein BP6252_05072 [Coleophoma cylindrospora]
MLDKRAKRGRIGSSESSRDTNLASHNSSSSGRPYAHFTYPPHPMSPTAKAASAHQPAPGGSWPGQAQSVSDNSREQVPANTLTSPSGKNERFEHRTRATTAGEPKLDVREVSHAPDAKILEDAASMVMGNETRNESRSHPHTTNWQRKVTQTRRISKLRKDAQIFQQYTADVTDALQRIRDDGTMSQDQLRAAIDRIMAMTPSPLSPDDGETSVSAAAFNTRTSERDDGGSGDEQAEIGSTESLDIIDTDVDKDDTRQTGHLGKSTAVVWAKRSAQIASANKGQDFGLGGQEGSNTLASYHTEDADIEPVELTGVQPLEWPEDAVANSLLEIYWTNVHDIFPILNKALFQRTYREFPKASRALSEDQRMWLAMLNSIWAISCVFARLTRQQYHPHYDDHTIYIARAEAISKESDLVYGNPRISMVQFLAMMSLYYLTTDRLNKSWSSCGLAIRHAMSLGLHVRQVVKSISETDREHRVRIWWCLYALDGVLDRLTGRPSCICDEDISAPLPANVNEEDFWKELPIHPQNKHSVAATEQGTRVGMPGRGVSSNRPVPPKRAYLSLTDMISNEEDEPRTTERTNQSTNPEIFAYSYPDTHSPSTVSSFFVYSTQLAIITHEIVSHLYSATTISQPWGAVQGTISKIDRRLLAWRENLPKAFNFSLDTTSEPNWNDPYLLRRMGLSMAFNSSRMVLFRPCLCRDEARLQYQSSKGKDFNHNAVLTCVRSARKMISLIHWFSGSPAKLYAIPPWWLTLHYICEALSVLMLEMAFQAHHMPQEAELILQDAKKGIRWLIMLSAQSISARKAWEIFDALLRMVAPLIDGNTQDMPTEAAIPPGYNWRRFNISSTGQAQSRGHDLTLANLEQYEDSQSPISGRQATTAWASAGQHSTVDAGSNLMPVEGHSMLQNMMDSTTALQRLENISRPHGGYDEPWHQFFSRNNINMTGGVAGSLMEIDDPQPVATGNLSQLQYTQPTNYPDLGDPTDQNVTSGGWFVRSEPLYSSTVPAHRSAWENPKGKGRESRDQN